MLFSSEQKEEREEGSVGSPQNSHGRVEQDRKQISVSVLKGNCR